MEQSNTPSELDIVFCCDCTGSMGSYIDEAKKNIRKIAEELHAMEKISLRYGLVAYRDHPPQDNTYATKVFPLTESIKTMQNNVSELSAQGGGDGPESVACALYEALNMDYRKDSARVVVIISDAPPHGLGESGDGFPNGCPCGHDPIQVAEKMAENKIVIYSVAVEPVISGYTNAKAFFHSIAEITSGRYLTLGNAHLLANVVIGGSAEELDLKKFEEEIVKETLSVRSAAPTITDDELQDRVEENLRRKGVKTWQLDVTHQEEDEHTSSRSKAIRSCKTLNEAREKLPAATSSSGHGRRSSGTRARIERDCEEKERCSRRLASPSTEPQTASYKKEAVSKSQIQKVWRKNKM